MRTKSAYREKPAENIPAVEAAIAPSPEASAVAVEVRPESEPQALSQAERHAEETKADAAAEALKRQLAELTRSEQLLRQQPQPPRPMTREQKLAAWHQQGMPADQLEFLKANPELVDHSDLAAFAANEAAQAGHERGSGEHMRATKELFDQHLAHLQAQAQQQTETAMNPTPKFFQPPPPPKPRTPPSIVSAPVSRETLSGGARPNYETDERRVVLSPEEKEVAAASGISLTEYARQKIRLEREKREGTRQ
jgi:hypothetical protein